MHAASIRWTRRATAALAAGALALGLAACGSQPPKAREEGSLLGPVRPMKTLVVYYNNALVVREQASTAALQNFRRRHGQAVRLLEKGLQDRGVKAYVHTSEIEGTPQEAARHGARVGADHLLVLYMTRATIYGRGGATGAVWRMDVHALDAAAGKTVPVYREQFGADETCTPWNKEGECEAFIPNYVLGVLEKRGFLAAPQGK
jgi:hypothetical protein